MNEASADPVADQLRLIETLAEKIAQNAQEANEAYAIEREANANRFVLENRSHELYDDLKKAQNDLIHLKINQ